MVYVYLYFTDVKQFVEYLKQHNIHRYGLIQRWLGRGNLSKYFFRLTAKDDLNEDIIVCDVVYYEGIDLATQLEKGKIKQLRDETLKEITEAFKGKWTFHQIPAEYRIEEEEYYKP